MLIPTPKSVQIYDNPQRAELYESAYEDIILNQSTVESILTDLGQYYTS